MARIRRAPQAAHEDSGANGTAGSSQGQRLVPKPKTPVQKLIDGTVNEFLHYDPPGQDRVRQVSAKLLHALTLSEGVVERAIEAEFVQLRKLTNENPDGSTVERLMAKRALARWNSIAGQEKRGLALDRYRDCHQLIWRIEEGEVGMQMRAYLKHLREVLPNERDECLE